MNFVQKDFVDGLYEFGRIGDIERYRDEGSLAEVHDIRDAEQRTFFVRGELSNPETRFGQALQAYEGGRGIERDKGPLQRVMIDIRFTLGLDVELDLMFLDGEDYKAELDDGECRLIIRRLIVVHQGQLREFLLRAMRENGEVKSEIVAPGRGRVLEFGRGRLR